MKILSASQVQDADQYTIKHEPISSLELMERASNAFVEKLVELFPEKPTTCIFCGTGNNGGDGLAISRILRKKGWQVLTYVLGNYEEGSDDFKANLERVGEYSIITDDLEYPEIEEGLIIDALFGSGLSRPLQGRHAEKVEHLNAQTATRIAVDIASGLFSDQPMPKGALAFRADMTISFQVPKLAFLLPESDSFVGDWFIVDIGLDTDFIESQETNLSISEYADLKTLLPARSRFAHKNQVGRLQIVAGSRGKMGAAVLCTRAAFKAGAGLVNVHVPACGLSILQTAVPEAMVTEDVEHDLIKEIDQTGDTVALGPGLGTNQETVEALQNFLCMQTMPLVIDADGINILSENPDMLSIIPPESILTPHPGEFKRLVGEWENDFEKIEKLRSFCRKYRLNVVLKGAFSAVCSSQGIISFNPSGNPGMATAGSGDVLTGVVGALLAQGLQPLDALRLGVCLHGLAGDLATEKEGYPWITASDIIDNLAEAASWLDLMY